MVLIGRVSSFTHCTDSTINAGIGDTIIDACLAVGSSPSWSTCTAEACNMILQKELHVNHSKLLTQCMIKEFNICSAVLISLVPRPPRPAFVACSTRFSYCKWQKLGMEAWEWG